MRTNQISLLDCTLRDGGYVNNWEFGDKEIDGIINGLIESGIEIIEMGFLRKQPYQSDRSVFSISKEIDERIANHVGKTKFSAMIEAKEDVTQQFPIDMISALKESGLSFVRIMQWEWLMEKHLEYCREAKETGMEISIQPTAIVDYDDDRFKNLLEIANKIHPFAFYLVDTWGTESPQKIKHWAKLADEYLDKDIVLGYHGHNNKLQALTCMEALLNMDLSRNISIDVSIGGMGKGPGNLYTEIAADYLNENYGKKYDEAVICDLYAKYIHRFYRTDPWGYSLYHFIGAQYLVTQNYATYFRKMDYGVDVFHEFVKSLKGREKVVFNRDFTENRLKEIGLK